MIKNYISLKGFDVNVNKESLWKNSKRTWVLTLDKVVSLERKCLTFVYCTFSTVIYLLEKIYFLRLTVWSDIFNFWPDRSIIWSGIYFCLEYFPSDRMSGVFSLWSNNFSFWSDTGCYFKAWVPLHFLNKQLEWGPSTQSCLYFEGFQGSKLLNGCSVLWRNKQTLSVFQWFFSIGHWHTVYH